MQPGPLQPAWFYANFRNRRLYACYAAPGGGFTYYWVVGHDERGFRLNEACAFVGGPFVAPRLSACVLDYDGALARWTVWSPTRSVSRGASTSPVTPPREE